MKLRCFDANIDDLDAFLSALDRIGAEYDCLIQAVDIRYLAGQEHAKTAVRHARRAIDNDDTIADDPDLEVLLYITGTRQIDDAFACGVREGQSSVAIIVDGAEEKNAVAAVSNRSELSPDTDAELGDPTLLADWFDITDTEQTATDASLEQLVCERVALLAIDH